MFQDNSVRWFSRHSQSWKCGRFDHLRAHVNMFLCLSLNFAYLSLGNPGFLPGIFSGGQNLLSCKFLLLCYCFQTKFQERQTVSGGGGGAPPLVEESQNHRSVLIYGFQFIQNSTLAYFVFLMECCQVYLNSAFFQNFWFSLPWQSLCTFQILGGVRVGGQGWG